MIYIVCVCFLSVGQVSAENMEEGKFFPILLSFSQF